MALEPCSKCMSKLALLKDISLFLPDKEGITKEEQNQQSTSTISGVHMHTHACLLDWPGCVLIFIYSFLCASGGALEWVLSSSVCERVGQHTHSIYHITERENNKIYLSSFAYKDSIMQ